MSPNHSPLRLSPCRVEESPCERQMRQMAPCQRVNRHEVIHAKRPPGVMQPHPMMKKSCVTCYASPCCCSRVVKPVKPAEARPILPIPEEDLLVDTLRNIIQLEKELESAKIVMT